jgi:hypothetical protein
MSWDLNKQPLTEDDFRKYFYTLIGKQEGQNASDYIEVMKRPYLWQGRMLMIPPGPNDGVKLDSSAPFFGLTQQYSDNTPKARIFLPTDTPDGNNYYTRSIQYYVRKEAGNDLHIWGWDYVAGNAYVPIPGYGTVIPPVTPPSDLEARVKALEAQNAIQAAQIKELQEQKIPKKIALRSLANGKFVATEIDLTYKILTASRDAIGPWEEFEFIVLE